MVTQSNFDIRNHIQLNCLLLIASALFITFCYKREKILRTVFLQQQLAERKLKDNLQEKIQELEVVSQTKDLVLATVTHDLKTPLNWAKQQIALCMQSESIEHARPYLNIALKSCNMLSF